VFGFAAIAALPPYAFATAAEDFSADYSATAGLTEPGTPWNSAIACSERAHGAFDRQHAGVCQGAGGREHGSTVAQADAGREQPSALTKGAYYTCPMPEHADVRSDQPGTCPRCGMQLVPKSMDEGEAQEPKAVGPDEHKHTH